MAHSYGTRSWCLGAALRHSLLAMGLTWQAKQHGHPHTQGAWSCVMSVTGHPAILNGGRKRSKFNKHSKRPSNDLPTTTPCVKNFSTPVKITGRRGCLCELLCCNKTALQHQEQLTPFQLLMSRFCIVNILMLRN